MSYTPPPPPPDPSVYGIPQTGARPGELLDRFAAKLIDGVLLVVVYVVVALVLIAGVILNSVGSTYVVGVVTTLVLFALQMGYYVYLESSRGQTVGKMVMKLRVVGAQGGNPSMEEAFRRNIWLGVGLLAVIPVLGLLSPIVSLAAVIYIAVTINGDPVARQGWHDKFAGGTRVIKEG
jgi:uncharacterized RDD family membrane protein YckC